MCCFSSFFTLEQTLICSLVFFFFQICSAASAVADKRLHNTSSKFCITKTCDPHRAQQPQYEPGSSQDFIFKNIMCVRKKLNIVVAELLTIKIRFKK